MTVTAPSGQRYSFAVEPARREALLAGLDEIGMTLQPRRRDCRVPGRDRQQRPWVHEI